MTITSTPKVWAAIAAGLIVIAAAVLALDAGASQAEEEPLPIELEPVTGRNGFTDDVRAQFRVKPDGSPVGVANVRDASNLAMAEITIQPGAQFPWHTHPGPVLIAITDGDEDGAFVATYADGCDVRPYEEGEAFVDLGNQVHTAHNPSDDEETVVIATFLAAPDADADDPRLTVPVAEEESDTLDEECGIER